MTVPLIQAEQITRRFGALVANDAVDIAVQPGEVHALLGENGAGKSTLVKMLYGLLQPDAGRILWQGQPVRLGSPRHARRLGIGMVFQHFSLFDALTVAENVALALDDAPPVAQVAARLGDISARYGLPLEPDRRVASLSVGERQRVEIVRCLMQDPRLLILDEPTSVLTPQEAEGLFATLDRLRAEGRSVLYISHKLEEVRRLCEAATILRHGKVVASLDPRTQGAGDLAALMVGSEIGRIRHDTIAPGGPVRLQVAGLTQPGLTDIRLTVHQGEVLGIAGVAGNGQEALFAALSGEVPAPRADTILMDGAAIGHAGVTERRRRGAAFVPEERLGHATAPRLPLSENALLTRHALPGLVRFGLFDRGRMQGVVEAVTRAFDLRKGTADPPARALSGGNLQKFVVGREILRQPRLLVVAQPSWGVDAGAAQLIRQALIDLARSGSAVVAISQDLDELLEMADRLSVICAGRLTAPRPVADLSREEIGLMMGGAA
jgi:simple sugar transport system ATP-binding protein